MKALFCVPWDQSTGGVANIVNNLARGLQGRGHDSLLLHPGAEAGFNAKTSQAGLPGYDARLRPLFVEGRAIRSRVAFASYFLPTLLKLRSFLRRESIDVVNVHYPVPEFAYLALLRPITPFRLIISVHGSDVLPGGAARDAYRPEVLLLLRMADRIVTPSRAMERGLRAVFPRWSEKIVTIHNGISLDGSAITTAHESQAKGECATIVCVAVHTQDKGLDVLLGALANLDETRNVRLVQIGDGPLTSDLEALANRLHVRAKVEFTGHLSHEETLERVASADIAVLPSRAEAFGLAAAEAMALGRPVVVSDVGGLPEVVDHEVTGLVVPPDDVEALTGALTRLLDSPDLRHRLGAAAAESARKRFDFHRTVMDYVSLFDETLRDAGGRTPGSHEGGS